MALDLALQCVNKCCYSNENSFLVLVYKAEHQNWHSDSVIKTLPRAQASQWVAVLVLAASLPIQLPAKGPETAAEDGPEEIFSSWLPAMTLFRE